MTIPTVVSKTQEKVAVSSLKKAYSTLENAFRLAVAENGQPENWTDKTDPHLACVDFLNIFASHLNLLKNCGLGEGCVPDVVYKNLHRANVSNWNSQPHHAKAQLADGTSLFFYTSNKDCDRVFGTSKALQNICGSIDVDINGFKSPNQYGKDFFSFYITKFGIIPLGNLDMPEDESFDNGCSMKNTNANNGVSCTAWVIYNENMDYLHCDDLSWNGKKKCGQ